MNSGLIDVYSRGVAGNGDNLVPRARAHLRSAGSKSDLIKGMRPLGTRLGMGEKVGPSLALS